MNIKVQKKTFFYIEYLRQNGHMARRPHADLLEDGIYELRIRSGSINYRILYFFHGQEVIVLAHLITKEDVVPPQEIKRAKERRKLYLSDPKLYSEDMEYEP